MRTVLTQQADADLFGITFYSLDNFGRLQADRYIEGAACLPQRAAYAPISSATLHNEGTAFPEGGFSFHVVFVLPVDENLIVVRILHDRMDPDNYLP